MAPILIFGYGNPSRGDDALGPELIQRLEHRQRDLCRRELAAIRAGGGATSAPVAMTDCPHHADPEKSLLERLDFLTDFQLQPEHALDLAGRARVILVDADKTPKNGNIVVARVDHECTIKRFYRTDHTVTLMPDSQNAKHQPMTFTKENLVQIRGVVDSVYLKKVK
jgi:Ni,Fe-hydrogenase maturation factor